MMNLMPIAKTFEALNMTFTRRKSKDMGGRKYRLFDWCRELGEVNDDWLCGIAATSRR